MPQFLVKFKVSRDIGIRILADTPEDALKIAHGEELQTKELRMLMSRSESLEGVWPFPEELGEDKCP